MRRQEDGRAPDMAMTAAELEAALLTAFPDAEVRIHDLAGDGDHYRAIVRSSQFNGKSRIEQHKMVYAALQGRMGVALHALALETSTKP
jgi:stress-induced morphogen